MDEEEEDQNRTNANPTENAKKRAANDTTPADNTKPKNSKCADDPEADQQCSICLKTLTTETIGKPDSCQHQFCLVCLLAWSKTKNQCPVDRIRYKKIFFTNGTHGKMEGHLTVRDAPAPANDRPVAPVVARRRTYICCVCAQGDHVNDIVGLCSGCRRGFHLACSEPHLDGDDEDWFCQRCVMVMSGLEVEDLPAAIPDFDIPVQRVLAQPRDRADGGRIEIDGRGVLEVYRAEFQRAAVGNHLHRDERGEPDNENPMAGEAGRDQDGGGRREPDNEEERRLQILLGGNDDNADALGEIGVGAGDRRAVLDLLEELERAHLRLLGQRVNGARRVDGERRENPEVLEEERERVEAEREEVDAAGIDQMDGLQAVDVAGIGQMDGLQAGDVAAAIRAALNAVGGEPLAEGRVGIADENGVRAEVDVAEDLEWDEEVGNRGRTE